MTKWNIFCFGSTIQESLNMFEEPRFVPVSDMIELSRSTRVDHLTGHHYSLIPREDQTLHKVTGIRPLHLLLEGLNHLLEGIDRGVVQLDEPLAGDDLDLHADQEAQSPITPGNGVEQVRIIVWRTCDNRAICQHQLETLANVLKQSIDMAAGFNTRAHHQSTNRQIIEFRN